MPSVVLRLAKVCARGKFADRWFERAGRVRREHSTGDRGRGVFNGTGGAHQNRGERMQIEVPRVNGRSRAARALDRGHHLHNGPLSALDNLQLRIESRDNLSVVYLSHEICERMHGKEAARRVHEC